MSQNPSEAELTAELNREAHEPFLPIETKLVSWSLGLGVGLLVVLAIVNRFLPVG